MLANRNRGASTECQASAGIPAQTPHHLFSATHCGVLGAPCAAVMAGRPPAGSRKGKVSKPSPTQAQRNMIAALVAQGASVAAIFREAGVARSAVRHFKATGGKSTRPRRQPFFSRAEEELLVRFIKLQAVVGCGLTRVGFLRWVGEYVVVLSSERQSTARAYFGGKLTTGGAFYCLFMRRWP